MNNVKKSFFSLFELTKKYKCGKLFLHYKEVIDFDVYKGLINLITNNQFSDIPLVVIAKRLKDKKELIITENPKLIYLIQYLDYNSKDDKTLNKPKMKRLKEYQILLITYSNENDKKKLEKILY